MKNSTFGFVEKLLTSLVVGSLLAASIMALFLFRARSESLESVPSPAAFEAPPAASPSEGVTKAEQVLLGDKAEATSKRPKFPLHLFKDSISANYYPSGWMGDHGDIRMNPAHAGSPHAGRYCIKIDYLGKGSQSAGWAGVYWLFPNSNWGNYRGGYDLTGAKKLTFWARGERGGEVILEAKVGGISGKYVDSASAGIGPLTLTTEWRQYQIDLSAMDLSYISGGFCWIAERDSNTGGCTFYLDDITYE
jgi:hypothetical protein